ncbi:hypothetical protein L218DRAFT_1010540 [Marasmius fiardii PR-910]|nr:hypothetical protein L218DRAFT_1010540 [Marasmius fiardii PR-910]
MEAIYHMSPETQKYLIEPMESAKGDDWEQFKKDLLDKFPEVCDDDIGSVTRLGRIQSKYKFVSQGDLGKLKAYHREFHIEVQKLLQPGKIVLSNVEAVKRYLGGLEPRFQKGVKDRLRDQLLEEKEWDQSTHQREDPFTLDKVMEMALRMASRSVSSNLYESEEEDYSHSTKSKKWSKESEDMTSSGSKGGLITWKSHNTLGLSKLKGEPDEWERKISTTLDSQDSSLKNMDWFMAESMKTMSALLKELQEQLDARPTSTYNNNSESSSPCILCHKTGHFQKDCPEGKELMEKGWICLQPGTNRVVMRNDSKIPWATFGSGLTRADLVRKIAEEKGWPGTKAAMQGFYFDIEEELPILQSYMVSGIENGNEDDEIASIQE